MKKSIPFTALILALSAASAQAGSSYETVCGPRAEILAQAGPRYAPAAEGGWGTLYSAPFADSTNQAHACIIVGTGGIAWSVQSGHETAEGASAIALRMSGVSEDRIIQVCHSCEGITPPASIAGAEAVTASGSDGVTPADSFAAALTTSASLIGPLDAGAIQFLRHVGLRRLTASQQLTIREQSLILFWNTPEEDRLLALRAAQINAAIARHFGVQGFGSDFAACFQDFGPTARHNALALMAALSPATAYGHMRQQDSRPTRHGLVMQAARELEALVFPEDRMLEDYGTGYLVKRLRRGSYAAYVERLAVMHERVCALQRDCGLLSNVFASSCDEASRLREEVRARAAAPAEEPAPVAEPEPAAEAEEVTPST